MTRIFNITTGTLFLALATLALTATMLVPGKAEAGGSTFSRIEDIPMLAYFWNTAPVYTSDNVPLNRTEPYDCWGHIDRTNCVNNWSAGLGADTYADIKYKAKMYYDGTNVEIPANTSLPVGTKFQVKRDESSKSRDINWNGTGYSSDSPNGNWEPDAGPRAEACKAHDKVGSYTDPIFGRSYDVFVLLNVADPTVTVVQGTNTKCTGNICEITDEGDADVSINFSKTDGKFYYRYKEDSGWNQGCHANNVPMREATCATCRGATNVRNSSYVAKFPQAAITFNLTGAPTANTKPNPPSICNGAVCSPTASDGVAGTSNTFTFKATDDDGDQIAYFVDWDNDGNWDAPRMPVAGYVNSGMQGTAPHIFPAGTHTFQAVAVDSKGLPSDPTFHTITVTTQPSPTVVTNPATNITPTTVTLNGNANPNGSPTIGWFRYSTVNPGICDDIFGTRVPAANGTDVGAGTNGVLFDEDVINLNPHTPYYYCALGQNPSGTSVGLIETVITGNSLPTADISITGTPVSQPPAGPMTYVQGDPPLILDGSGTDLDGDPITTYEWDDVCTPGGARYASTDSFDTSSLAPGTTHRIYLIVQDSEGDYSTNCPYVDVTVDPPAGPAPTCPPDRINNCVLPTTSEGNSAGSCAAGYTKTCSYTCGVGSVWGTPSSNLCEVLPPVVVDFSVCDLGGANCVSSGGLKKVPAGDPLEIHWDAPNAESCSAFSGNNFNTGNLKTGTDNTVNAPATPGAEEDFTVLCVRGSEFPVIKTVTVRSDGGPTIRATPPIVKVGNPTTIIWDNDGVNDCTVKGGGLDIDVNTYDPDTDFTINTQEVVTINGRTVFTLTCPGNIKKTATVEVVGKGFET